MLADWHKPSLQTAEVFSDLLETHQELDYLIKHQRALLLSALCSFILCTERAGQFYLKYSGLMV